MARRHPLRGNRRGRGSLDRKTRDTRERASVRAEKRRADGEASEAARAAHAARVEQAQRLIGWLPARFWQDGPGGPRFLYTTRADPDGWYVSYVEVPCGRGSRSGNAVRFKLDGISWHKRRKDARATALRRFNDLSAHGRKTWR